MGVWGSCSHAGVGVIMNVILYLGLCRVSHGSRLWRHSEAVKPILVTHT